MGKDGVVLVNATNIGRFPNGIGIYTLCLLRELTRLESQLLFKVFLNEEAKDLIASVKFPWNFSIRWVPRHLSPGHGFRGHMLRFVFSNFLAHAHRNCLIFNTSQLEAALLTEHQVVTVHDIIPLLFPSYHKKQSLYFRFVLGYALKRAKCIITPSARTKHDLVSFYGLEEEKIRPVAHGIQDLYLMQKRNPSVEREHYILYAGRISPTKNVHRLIEAFSMIRDRIGHDLVIVGEDGKGRPRGRRIVFKGYVSKEELANLYGRAALFVFPSLYEGFGLPPLEAMACGCPVVVSKAGSLPEICGDAAYYVDPYDVEEIAEGICRVLTDTDLRAYLVKKGLERVKLFSWRRSAEAHLRLFKELLNNP